MLRKGYGYACLKGIDYLRSKANENDIIVFIDGDYSDYPEEIERAVEPIITSGADLVIGSRVMSNRQSGSMLFHQIAGNWLATLLIKFFLGIKFTDLGPFRAIKWKSLEQLKLIDTTYGWTVEMQVKAAKLKLKCTEVPVFTGNELALVKSLALLWPRIKYYLQFLRIFNSDHAKLMWEFTVIILYCFFLFFIILFSLGQLALLITFLRNKNKTSQITALKVWPKVTIQLPIYNERFVIERLLDSIASLNYPKDNLEIQVLDDSTDDTVSIAAAGISALRSAGFNIEHIRRTHREGFKAGALQMGLEQSSGEFLAIFDADFIPPADFLQRTLPHFTERTGMVQTRWGHINPKQSWLTRAQEIGLNSHFIIDQEGRNKSGYFISFNGTAGIWRKSCITDAGGWQSDTLTEDLDLSYRAQMLGWEFSYCPEIITPAELPHLLNGVRSQQFRWIKGGVETSKKLLFKLWRCNISLPVKLFATFHLLSNYVYVAILLTGILSVPAMFVKNMLPEYDLFFKWNAVFFIAFMINLTYCFTAVWMDKKEIRASLTEISKVFPIAMLISLGLSYNNTKAILYGLRGTKTPFIRTPKFNRMQAIEQYPEYKDSVRGQKDLPEFLLFIYFLLAVLAGIYFKDLAFLLYHLLFLSGFGLILYIAFNESESPVKDRVTVSA